MFKTLRNLWHELKPQDKKYLSLALWTIAILGFLSIFILPKVFNLPAPTKWMEFDDKTSNVSNTVNGIAAPFIALASAILTFLAFWVQYQANVQQKQLFDAELEKKQKDDAERDKTWRIERFENRFYELIKLHKANVDEMSIGDKLSGRKLFGPMFYELRFAYFYTEAVLRQNPTLRSTLPNPFNLLGFAYKIFFFGIGPNSEKNYVVYLSPAEIELYKIVKKKFWGMRESYQSEKAQYPGHTYYTQNVPLAAEEDQFTVSFYYTPFDGHVSRLGHYYRHLFQTANYITGQAILDEKEKYGYIKILRAQLSNFEQLLLYYNARAWFESEWRALFTEYRLIKNLPLPLADFDENPEEHYADDIENLSKRGIEMFEWNE